MRKLKFRVWDKKLKKFRRADCQGKSTWGVEMNNGVFEIKSSDTLDVSFFTGLFDEHNREIYEGDIIEHRFDKTSNDENSIYFGSTLTGIVSFCDARCAYKLTIIRDNEESKHMGEEYQLFNRPASKTIIGNIFENPELLTNA